MRIGGVQTDLPAHAEKVIKDFIKYERGKLKEYNELLTYNAIFLARTKKIGILKPEVAINYSVTGPMLRATGVKWDIRKEEPYMFYDRFKFDVPVGTVGDSWDRFKVRLDEISESELQAKLKPIPVEVISIDALQQGGIRMDLALPLLGLLIVTLLTEGWLAQRI